MSFFQLNGALVRHQLKPWLSSAKALNAPNFCQLCQAFDFAGDDAWLCQTCADQLPRMRYPLCFKCGFPQTHALTCLQCRNWRHLDGLRSIAPMSGSAKVLLGEFKFGGKLPLVESWLKLIDEQTLRDWIGECDAISCVPSATDRLRWRGYHVADIVAKRLAKQSSLAFHRNLLRHHGSQRQTGLPRKARLKNMRGCFTVYRTMTPVNRLLVVDDVATTGATLNEFAKVVKRAGLAKRVYSFTLTRTLSGPNG